MTVDELFGLLDPVLYPVGFRVEDGEEHASPPLDVLRFYRRPVRLHWAPLIGRAQAVVVVVRQPVDLAGTEVGMQMLAERLAAATTRRFPPSWALGLGSIGLTTIVLTPEPIAPEDDDRLKAGLAASIRSRVVPLGVLRLNLGQEAMAFHLAGGPDGLFPEPIAVVDALTPEFRRFVPTFDWQ